MSTLYPSTLVREKLAQLAAAVVNWIVGTASARPIPLGAFMASVGENVTEPAPSVRRVINALVAQQRQGRMLIGIDDAHLLDGFSAHVVHQLAQTREARLVVTVRTGGREPDAVKALWKDGLLARLDLATGKVTYLPNRWLGPIGGIIRW